jgi:L-serine dehydratase
MKRQHTVKEDFMESIGELFRIGYGPSSSHTMGPRLAAERFRERFPDASSFRVTLYGSLAATGRGHRTDHALEQAFAPRAVEIVWKPDETLPFHPLGMRFEARLLPHGKASKAWQVYSLGGGAIGEESAPPPSQIYPLKTFADILARCQQTGQDLWEYVQECEGEAIWSRLNEDWKVMQAAIRRGLEAEGVLPGGLGLSRKAWIFYRKASSAKAELRSLELLSAYALAGAEENASGGQVVTAPTCGSCGILPAVLLYLQEAHALPETAILHALATAGLIGNLVKHNASISGAEVGCQGEVGTACAMAAGAAAHLLGGTIRQVEYAAEMGLEHNLGLTCDPVKGLVQIPCIERNAFAAAKALHCAEYANATDGSHRIPFDDVVTVMWETGNALPSLYRETGSGGLAKAFTRRQSRRLSGPPKA